MKKFKEILNNELNKRKVKTKKVERIDYEPVLSLVLNANLKRYKLNQKGEINHEQINS